MRELNIKIYGLNLTKVIDYLLKKHIMLNNIKIKNKYMIFSININDKNELDYICKRENKRYIILNKSIFLKIQSKCMCLFGSLFALVLTFIYIFSYSSIIFNIDVLNETNVRYDINKVYSVLYDNNINIGVNKINGNNLRKILLNNLNDIADCLVEYKGSKLQIKIYPEIKKEEIKENNLYSKYDAVVSDINVFSGKTNLKVGDIVKRGDIIISNEAGASGDVKGKVYFSSTKLYNLKQEKKIFTGKFLRLRNIFIFNKKLNKTRNNDVFSKYLTKKCDFYLTDKYFLPIKIESDYLFEYDIVEEYVSFENVEEDIKKEVYDAAMKNVPDKAEILNCTYSIVKEGDLVRIDCFIETIVDLV